MVAIKYFTGREYFVRSNNESERNDRQVSKFIFPWVCAAEFIDLTEKKANPNKLARIAGQNDNKKKRADYACLQLNIFLNQKHIFH